MTFLAIGLLHFLSISSAKPGAKHAASVAFVARALDAEPEILSKYLDAAERQQAALRGVQMEASLDGSFPKLQKRGHLTVLRSISKLGQITYQVLTSSGDRSVRREVIIRYLTADSQPRDTGALAITPANYRFRLKGATGSEKRLVYMFQLTPRKKKVGLFKGELWVDGETSMPLRESGQFVRNPSMFIKRIRFVREYEIQSGVAVPKRIESTVDARLVGRAELRIEFSNVAQQAAGAINPIREELKR